MQKLRLKIVVLLIILLICTQCSLFNKKSASINIKRFEIDFFSIDTNKFDIELKQLAEKYPVFYPVFIEGILNLSSNYKNIDAYRADLYLFRTHPQLIGLYDSIIFHYPNVDEISVQINNIVKKYNEYFPKESVHEVVTFLSEFGNKAVVYDGGIGIGLDMFLGSKYPYYKSLNIPDYIIKDLNKEQIEVNVARVLAEDFVPPDSSEASLLDVMIKEGKKLYFAEKILSGVEKNRIIEYTTEQYDWCVNNEFNIWSFFTERDLFYNKDFADYKRYVEDAPTTLGMPPESPGKIGIWLGWQIVSKYMEEHKNVRLEELMGNANAQELLTQSKFKPKVK